MTKEERDLLVEFMLNINNTVTDLARKHGEEYEELVDNHTILQVFESLGEN